MPEFLYQYCVYLWWNIWYICDEKYETSDTTSFRYWLQLRTRRTQCDLCGVSLCHSQTLSQCCKYIPLCDLKKMWSSLSEEGERFRSNEQEDLFRMRFSKWVGTCQIIFPMSAHILVEIMESCFSLLIRLGNDSTSFESNQLSSRNFLIDLTPNSSGVVSCSIWINSPNDSSHFPMNWFE